MVQMVRRNDSRDRMIAAARRLFREQGYVGTALSDVLDQSAAPRGSLYYYFPGGKEELAVGVTSDYSADLVSLADDIARDTDSAADFVSAFCGYIRDEFATTGYRRGCAIAPIVIESTPDCEVLSEATREGFVGILSALAARLTEKGISARQADKLASNIIVTIEGALIMSRVLRSPAPFNDAIEALTSTTSSAVAPG